MAKKSNAAWDITQAEVGDIVVLGDGRTVSLDGIMISTEVGNRVLVADTWIDAVDVAGAAN